jgi:uncharacterized protein YvpB
MREFPFSELLDVLRELQREGYPMCTSSDGHSIALLGVDDDRIDLRDPYGRRCDSAAARAYKCDLPRRSE